MRKLLITLLLLAGLTLAAGISVQAAPEPAATEELYWDADTTGGEMYNCPRAVWFVMPFDGTIITARTGLGTDGTSDAYDIIFCDRGT
ncbi:MAG: hypothetical protein GF403_06735, partial [Candidatus Coatesbacteria bacterium]|nr:hypothetical protein [Candidatus Coatesbacteria bacterium]